MGIKAMPIVLLLSLCIWQCGHSTFDLPDTEDLPVTTLEKTEGFRVPTAGHVVIRDSTKYARFVERYWVRDDTPPEIDFSQNQLLGVFYGAHYSGCQSEVEVIDKVRYFVSSMFVEVGDLPDLGLCEAIVAPHQFAVVPSRMGTVFFQGQAPDIQARSIGFQYLPDFENFFVTTPGVVLFRDEASWLELWDDTWTESDANGKTPPPEVDFSQDMVLAVFYGEGYSGCEQRTELVAEVEETCPLVCDNNFMRVTLRELPDDLGACRQALAPLSMVVLPRSDLELIVQGPSPQ